MAYERNSMIHHWNIYLVSLLLHVIFIYEVWGGKKCCLWGYMSALRHRKLWLTGKLEDIYGKC